MFTIRLLDGAFAICRLPRDSNVPPWAFSEDFSSITRTPDELSIVCLQRVVPQSVTADAAWRCLGILGPLQLSLVGVLAQLTAVLAQEQIPVVAISTYDTDYLFVKQEHLEAGLAALLRAGNRVVR